jgi:hypothetical protein
LSKTKIVSKKDAGTGKVAPKAGTAAATNAAQKTVKYVNRQTDKAPRRQPATIFTAFITTNKSWKLMRFKTETGKFTY